MDKHHDIDLRSAIPETPDFCREAVLHAVSTYREEETMRKPFKMILASALALMLLCGTAFAIVNHYSVRDYVADGNPSAAFEEAIVPLEKTATACGLSFTLGDAVFDGKDLAFTMHMTAEEGASPCTFIPDFRASAASGRWTWSIGASEERMTSASSCPAPIPHTRWLPIRA